MKAKSLTQLNNLLSAIESQIGKAKTLLKAKTATKKAAPAEAAESAAAR